jgi:aminodeoxyfutalosine deaminase
LPGLTMPGLVNAHCHLQLSSIRRETMPTTGFGDWLTAIGARLAPNEPGLERRLADAVRAGVSQSLSGGVTCVGDITWRTPPARSALSRLASEGAVPRVVSFGEALGLGPMRGRFEQGLAEAINAAHASPRLSMGIAPHAPYTVDADGYRAAIRLGGEHRMPITTHLAEHAEESRFLRSRTGLFKDIYDRLGIEIEAAGAFQGSPIAFAESTGLLAAGAVLAHVNHLESGDLDRLARHPVGVVYCPRTHAYFGHDPHPMRAMLAAGVNVCLGTDSAASAGDLNLIDDARLVRRIHPEMSDMAILSMITDRPAQALRIAAEVGSITIGRACDLICFDVENEARLLERDCPPSSVWIGGRWVAGAAM